MMGGSPQEREQKMKRKKKKKIGMRRKPKPIIIPHIKIKHPTIFVRKDGKQTCFVCYKPLHLLRNLLEMGGTSREGSDEYFILKRKVANRIVYVGKREGTLHPLYRCSNCEPGSIKYMKNKQLKKHFLNTIA